MPGTTLPPHLHGERLTLRPFTPADEPLIARSLADPEIARWAIGAGLRAVPPVERPARWLQARITSWAAGIPVFAIADSATGALNGYIGLRSIHNGNAVVGSWIAPWARGRGMAAGALITAAAWALSPTSDNGLGLYRIELHHAVGNPASCTVAGKAALTLEGTMRQATVDGHGVRHDSHLHARLATDPAPLRGRSGRVSPS
ncbi:GNAT family N-acetyltransferase [Streptomyces sp. NPDC048448]|uniref:GNAT family N-acetyltransferase n=1 Tax=Streptomyces sp. NPDC048448 TaxID=3365554 RepID=UPI0037205E81